MATSENEKPSWSEQLYRQLLEFHSSRDVEPLLCDALRLLAAASTIEIAYLELSSDETGSPSFWKCHGLPGQPLDLVHSRISTEVIAFAIAEGRSIITASALSDDTLKDLVSVKENAIEAVLCVPIGIALPLGVLYLQRSRGAGPFTPADRARAELFAHQVALVVGRLLRVSLVEETRLFAQHQAHLALRRSDGHLKRAARELGIGRAWLRKLLRK